jgi:hypothetical protein
MKSRAQCSEVVNSRLAAGQADPSA